MYLQHWGLRAEPFDNRCAPELFVGTPVHQEALARLHFLAENHRPLGFMAGPAGAGKSLVFNVFARRMRRIGAQAAIVSLQGLLEEEALAAIAAGLGELVEPAATSRSLWRTIQQRLEALRLEQQSTFILLDDAEGGFAFGRRLVERLLPAGTAIDSRHTVVLAGADADLRSYGRDLLERADLRIDLPPLSNAETADYVAQRLSQAGASRSVFEYGALEELARLSSGIPRRINQLAQLCLVAAAAQGAETIESGLPTSVFEELRPFAAPAHTRHASAVANGWTVSVADEG